MIAAPEAVDLQLLELVRQQPELARAHPILWALYASQGKWRSARHLKFLADHCMRMVRGEASPRLIVSMPPRHGKTQFIWRYFATWWLGCNPDKNVITCTYQERQAKRWSRQMRGDLHSAGRDVFGVWAGIRAGASEWAALKPDGRPADGLMTAVGSGGAVTGKGCDLLVLDDPIKGIKEARSKAVREATWEWFDADLMTRVEPGGLAILVMTRWHSDDIVGRIKRAQAEGSPPGGEPWVEINLPALAEEGDALGRAPGEALWPERWSAEALAKKRRGMDPYSWSALFGGRPVPGEGGLFKREWIRHADVGAETVTMHGIGTVRLADMTRFATLDLAATGKTGDDWWVCSVWAALPRVLVLLDRIRLRVPGPEFLRRARELCRKHRTAADYIESVAWQLMFIQQARLEGWGVRELVADRDKIARALPATAAMEGGEVFFPRGATWLPEWETELLEFGPGCEHDDQVDTLSYAVKVWRDQLGGSGLPPAAPPPAAPRGPGIPQLARPRR